MPAESAQYAPRPDSARKVKITNNGDLPHKETYRGVEYVIPPKGFITMGAIEGNRFISQWYPLKKVLSNGTVVSQGKPLSISELTSEERAKIEGITEEQHKQGIKLQDVRASLTCMKCGFVGQTPNGLKSHMTMKHPEMEPVEE